MKTQFPLFNTHLDLAHHYWRPILTPGAIAVDATCGNGQDTLALAKMLCKQPPSPVNLFALDIQPAAIAATQQLLASENFSGIKFYNQCHSTFPQEILPETAALIVYNLGYLPGGDKTLTTMRASTLRSLEAATKLVKPCGAISVTCYPGHPEGLLEEQLILEFAATLNPRVWSACHHRWLNRKASPSLLVIQKSET